MLTYAHVCSHMLTWQVSQTNVSRISAHAHVCSRMLTLADVCLRMLSLQVSHKNVSRISAHGKGVAIDKDNQNCPSLVNLNEDPLMTECLIYFLPPGQTLGTASFFYIFSSPRHHELLYEVVRLMTECLLY